MSDFTIKFAGAMPVHSGGVRAVDIYPFVPCFDVTRDGADEVYLKVWIQLSGYAATLMKGRLERDGSTDIDSQLSSALTRYGVARIERHVRNLDERDELPEKSGDVWRLTNKDELELLALINNKTCDYQKRGRRDVFCTAPSPRDDNAVFTIEGRSAAPTSRATCRECDLPDTDYLCSNFLHPEVGSIRAMGGLYRRSVGHALCDIGRDEVVDHARCHAGGHDCWQRTLAVDPSDAEPQSTLGLAESLDVLDAQWRLTFGKSKQLVVLTNVINPASLSLDCSDRATFESRVSALADIIDKLKVDASLLPADKAEELKGRSLDRLEVALLRQLSSAEKSVLQSIRTLRRVRQARNAIQHGRTEGGGLTGALADLGIGDAPPNWREAWDSIRSQTTNSLATIRTLLRKSDELES